MRLGIVIGVKENRLPFHSLAACGNDAEAMAAVLRETGRFDDIIVLKDQKDTASKVLKSRIVDFIDKHKGNDVEELVFYFSGHGDFIGDEFYHILSDYENSARNQTSLANSDLDGMMRGLNPALFVKIVDACHSGTSYIKNSDAFDDYLKGTKAAFKDVYFLYSSQIDEASWTDGNLSAFTKSILTPIALQDAGAIRYRDLMSAASDHFESTGRQTPRFITQADFTQVFCNASPAMQATVHRFLPDLASPSTPTAPSALVGKSASLIDRIKVADERFCTRDEAVEAMELLRSTLSAAAPSGELAEVFDWEVTASSGEPDGSAALGEWLNKHADRSFFAYPVYRTEVFKKRVPKDALSWLSVTSFIKPHTISDSDTKLVDATRQVMTGYKNTAMLPFDKITLRLVPRFKSVLPRECYVAPIVSGADLRLFWALRSFQHADWNTTIPSKAALQWDGEDALLKDRGSIEALARRISSTFIEAAGAALASQWPDPTPKMSAATKPRRGQ